MADKNNPIPENVPGRWYVDQTCACCNACFEITNSSRMIRANEEGHAYFYRQPTPGEEGVAQEIMESCPTNAIGDNGEGDDNPFAKI